MVTTGCQEAMILLLRALRTDTKDAIMAPAPTYVGFLGAARLMEMPVLSVAEGTGGIDVEDLVVQVRRARERGLRPRACYVVPDFANPSGLSMSLADRRRLLEAAEQEELLLIEDNTYSLFNSDGRRLPSLKSLDTARASSTWDPSPRRSSRAPAWAIWSPTSWSRAAGAKAGCSPTSWPNSRAC
ncbi:aminotransferase class I/II-fold pyridoxal phosphate-dependent enzyme [Streptomyces sp. NPDC050529]|uniref:aminotransferase class I/II-fold pyridoxal phosphate-dependent enzyme n=1 Tax=Streptomyces sp. NPDC050529 TaxID=3365624 RepID=UPI00378B885E